MISVNCHIHTIRHVSCKKESELVIVTHPKTYSINDAQPAGNGELCERTANIIQFALSYVLSLFKATYLLLYIICQLYQTRLTKDNFTKNILR